MPQIKGSPAFLESLIICEHPEPVEWVPGSFWCSNFKVPRSHYQCALTPGTLFLISHFSFRGLFRMGVQARPVNMCGFSEAALGLTKLVSIIPSCKPVFIVYTLFVRFHLGNIQCLLHCSTIHLPEPCVGISVYSSPPYS